jgi:trafficking protein particle complex subunit 12
VLVLSRVGRIHLQMGDLSTADNLFCLARSLAERGAQANSPACVDAATGELRQQLRGRLLVNDGLLLFAQNKLQEALGAFDAALHLEMAQPPTTPTADVAHELLEEDLVCVAVNNFAICALYCCDVQGAVAALERMIRSDPVRFLNAVVVFNLSSLYDLVFDNATSASRKEMMKKLAERYDLEHIDAVAFRI